MRKNLTDADAVTLLITFVLLYLKVAKVFDGELSQDHETVMENSFLYAVLIFISQRHLYRCRLYHVSIAILCRQHHPCASCCS